MDKILIRPAQPEDAPAIHEAHMRSIREVCVRDHGEEEIRGWGNRPLDGRWSDSVKNGYVWVVEGDGRIFGHAFIRIYTPSDKISGEKPVGIKAHIHGLYLTPEVLGQGFGRALAKLMLEKAKEAGASTVTLESTLTAHEFYKNLGFKDNGPLQKQEIAGYPVSYFPMSLQLD